MKRNTSLGFILMILLINTKQTEAKRNERGARVRVRHLTIEWLNFSAILFSWQAASLSFENCSNAQELSGERFACLFVFLFNFTASSCSTVDLELHFVECSARIAASAHALNSTLSLLKVARRTRLATSG